MILALSFWANHCIISDVLALAKKTKQTSDSTPSSPLKNTPCHSKDSGNTHSDESSNTKSSDCQKFGCCQPALNAPVLKAIEIKLAELKPYFSPPLIIEDIFLSEVIGLKCRDDCIKDISPPYQHISSLDTAPNAPPAKIFL